jgi:hypothetical protein
VEVGGCSSPVGDGLGETAPVTLRKNETSPGFVDLTFDSLHCSGDRAAVLGGALGAFAGWSGCVVSDAGTSGAVSFDGSGFSDSWFTVIWTRGPIAGHPGYARDESGEVERTWSAIGNCGLTTDDHSHATCP